MAFAARTPFVYGEYWATSNPLEIEMACIVRDGKWISKATGQEAGAGLFHHYKRMMQLLWPGEWWSRWDTLIITECINSRFLGIAGGSSSGKTHRISRYCLCRYWCFPNNTTILCSTTTRPMLELRIFGEIKKGFKQAKERYPGLAGHITGSKLMITTDGKEVEAREFRNGIVGVPCKVGDKFVGLGDYVGIKNDNMVLAADELHLMSRAMLDSTGNMSANKGFQLIGLGNPNSTDNAFGALCEPTDGWDTFNQGETTTVWNTRYQGGRCLRLVGTDSPNFDRADGLEVYPKLIGRRYVNEIASTYGTESWQYLMWVLARFPTSVLERRVLTRQMCVRFGAFEPVVWGAGELTRLFAIDAAYGAVGGDRCVGGEWAFGEDNRGVQTLALEGKPVLIPVSMNKADGAGKPVLPEDQIVIWVKNYCTERGIAPEHVVFDSTGRGSLMSAFARLWSPHVVALEFGGRATDRPCPADPRKSCRESYGKFVSELWFTTRVIVEAAQMRGLTEDIVAEFQMRAWAMGSRAGSGAAVADVEPKDETKERLGRSPDLADMAVAACELARRLGFHIAKLSRRGARSENLLLKLKEEWDKMERGRELRSVA